MVEDEKKRKQTRSQSPKVGSYCSNAKEGVEDEKQKQCLNPLKSGLTVQMKVC